MLSRALGDDADNPGFSETLPRRGYRFTASVAPASSPATAVAAMSSSPTPGALVFSPAGPVAPVYDRRPEDGAHRAALQGRVALAVVTLAAVTLPTLVTRALALNVAGLRGRFSQIVGAVRPSTGSEPRAKPRGESPLRKRHTCAFAPGALTLGARILCKTG